MKLNERRFRSTFASPETPDSHIWLTVIEILIMAGFLVPPWYKEEVISNLHMNIASIFWGLTFGVAIFTASKATKQTLNSWLRARRATAYVWMIWGEWMACLIISFLTWFYMWGTIETRYIPFQIRRD